MARRKIFLFRSTLNPQNSRIYGTALGGSPTFKVNALLGFGDYYSKPQLKDLVKLLNQIRV